MGETERANRPSIEYTAKTEQEALGQASREMGVPPQQLEYEVIRDSTRTLFGLVRTGDVSIRVWSPRKEAEDAAGAPAEPAPSAVSAVDAGHREVAVRHVPERTASAGAPDSAQTKAPPRAVPVADAKAAPTHAGAPEKDADLEETAIEVVSTLLDKMGMLAAVEVVDRGGRVEPGTGETTPLILNVVGDDLGSLLGRRGETLRDFQFIVRLMISRRLGHWPDLVVDVEGYKVRREEILRSLAQRMRDQVVRTGRSAVLEPMPANERRIVHISLRDDPDVYTESTGEGDHRKVQILPK